MCQLDHITCGVLTSRSFLIITDKFCKSPAATSLQWNYIYIKLWKGSLLDYSLVKAGYVATMLGYFHKMLVLFLYIW